MTGLDLNPNPIGFCAQKMGDVKLGDVENLPFENETFDLILTIHYRAYVDDDGRSVLELQRVQKIVLRARHLKLLFNSK